MKIVQMYEAEDGTQFRYEDDCLRHEAECENLKAAKELLNNGAPLIQAIDRFNVAHDFGSKKLSDDDRHVLSNITKDTGLRVRHWQCSDVPGYKPCDIDLRGRVYLWGYAGSWSGNYGGWVTIDDLLRYAKDTLLNRYL